ncbi:dipeptidase A. Cysteine peptidase. MEROPS family C69 [Ligilactobacillus sp. WC1T17]|uniref:Dipeptidase n=2 Tax=Ligilactobacillus TaxID=2767887 RepID=A0ABY1AAC1_9LACO|nr:dipeptidase A. Cysteine peptidase. MEROPS family C69 [Ligilactobacillus ruminis]
MLQKSFEFSACTSILVGKKAMADGSTVIGRNEDAKSAWPKKMTVHPHENFTEPQTFTSKDNGFSMPLPNERFKYTATPEWTDEFGLFEEDGINEYGVCMSATESAYANERVLGFDPLVEKGIGEEAMVTCVLPYVKSARQGVERLGEIVSTYGTCESNGILFSDQDEVWYMETGSGHHWVAQRIPDDCYAVCANQLAIQEIDFDDPANFMFSKDILAFVNGHHLNPQPQTFNFRNIFGTHTLSDEIYSTPRVWYGQRYLTPSVVQEPMSEDLPFIQKADRLLYLDDLEYVLGSHFQNTPYDPLGNGPKELKNKFRPISLAKTQESHLLQMRSNLPVDVAGLHYLALGVTCQSVYVPVYAGTNDVIEAYKHGQKTYSTDSAYWDYKLLGILVDPHYPLFGQKLHDLQKECAIAFAQKIAATDQLAQTLNGVALTEALTKASMDMQQLALDKVKDLTADLITASTDLSPLNFKTDANL